MPSTAKKKWQKSSPELISRFDACLPSAVGVQRRQMFGYPCAFVNGNMFTGLHEQRLVVRLPEADRNELLRAGDAAAFTVMGRTMREYVVIADALERSPSEITAVMRKALAYARALPVKQRKAK
jgi:TfoX/Sxy family transcriptional regulator of competence genes